MRLQRSDKFANRCVTLTREALGFSEHIQEEELDLLRYLAFECDEPSRAVRFDPFCYLASEIFSKWTENKLPTARRDAIARFKERELVNRNLNAKLADLQYEGWLGDACRLVERVLKGITVESVIQRAGFSGGASASVPRHSSTPADKWAPINYRGLPQFGTSGIWSYYDALLRGCAVPGLGRGFTLVPGDTIDTVNKNWKIDRIINPQPALNLFFQRGLGGEIRRGLRKFGLLHPNAQETQRARAKQGSITGDLATLDLRDASTSVTTGMVDTLVEGPVRKMLYDFRSPGTWLGCKNNDGSFNREGPWTCEPYEMISTMGNGYTFELETMLFWAVAAAKCKQLGIHWSQVTVYGDDIICPTRAVDAVREGLLTFGLELNDKKSFYHPYPGFRESCGGHYWMGYDVTPFYLKRAPDNVGDVILLHNKVVKWEASQEIFPWVQTQPDFTAVKQFCRRETPARFRGPRNIAGCLWSEWDQARPTFKASTQSYAISVVVKDSAQKAAKSQEGAYLAYLWNASRRSSVAGYAPCRYRQAGALAHYVKSTAQEVKTFGVVTSDEHVWEDESTSTKYRAVNIFVDRDAWDLPDLMSA